MTSEIRTDSLTVIDTQPTDGTEVPVASRIPLVRVVDDDERVRRSEAFVLQLDGWQVAEFESADDFLQRDDTTRPGCLILDIRMPGKSGLELQQILKTSGRTLPILFLTGHGDIDTAVMALKRGAADFVQKPMDPEKLQAAVRRLVSWHVGLAERLEIRREALLRFEELTQKEKEVCRAVASGALNKQIAARLGISEQTVKTHRGNVTRKLELRTAVEIADFLKIVDNEPDQTFHITENSENRP